jgi:hydrogenase maturation protein HypF
MMLEAAADEGAAGTYSISLIHESGKERPAMLLDWRPMIKEMLDDRRAGVEAGAMALKFHRAMADGIVAVCQNYREYPIVLTGGVFQNRLLTELVVDRFDLSRQLGLPGVIPPGDGGLAAGQLAAATKAMEA